MRDQDDQLHIYELYGVSTPRVIKATMELRNRIGHGTKITSEQIEKAQDFIDTSGLDYSETALGYIKQLEGVIEEMRLSDYDRESDYNMVSMPIVQIKGQAGMFGNDLASALSYRILVFLEKFRRLDDAVLDIVGVYCQAIKLSYNLKLYNIDTKGGKEIVSELDGVLERYRQKFADNIQG
ncbi:MAG: hypothetical protein COB76_05710 [Alphaproteobacteria bacterium]|nr:MAG: hypothetical protein COB76_05710 [Alphaproteobacteria bacterium]